MSNIDFYAVIGAGGYGREVMPLVRQQLASQLAAGKVRLFFVVEGEPSIFKCNEYPVMALSDFKNLPGDKYFTVAIADSKVRERISSLLYDFNCKPFSIFSKNSIVMDNNKFDDGLLLSPFTTITSNVTIGKFFHANIYSYVAHDCQIGNFVTFAPGVKCNGNVIIEDHAYIGTGAVIKQGAADNKLVIGRGAIVGMGSVVTKSVPAYTTVLGNPARVFKNER
ncbi:acetyltransferase [Microvirga sp. W0021]|uniref:Acetyltransferase n=1 Tax=Hohaiivirga grylli TaxID=3133970 RepID=A0ABV0BI67_9HYPH